MVILPLLLLLILPVLGLSKLPFDLRLVGAYAAAVSLIT